jgi:NTP pyrophosphatase (non-canonical NTP hydrolase)
MDIVGFTTRVLSLIETIEAASGRHTAQSAFIHLIEEIGEVARQVTNEHQRPTKFDRENLGAELADALVFMVLFAHLSDIDLSVEMEKAIGRLEAKVARRAAGRALQRK